MEKIARECFPKAAVVTDRFHVAKLVSEAVQEIRIKHRWEAIESENKKIKEANKIGEKYVSPTFENGNTVKQLLAKSRYLLFKPKKKWTDKQSKRAGILFKEYPDIKHAYELSMMFRNVYETSATKKDAEIGFENWIKKIEKYNYSSFVTASESIRNHKYSILNFFVNRTTKMLLQNILIQN